MNIPRMKGALDRIADRVKEDNRSLTSHHTLFISHYQSSSKFTYQEHINSILLPFILEVIDISPPDTFRRIAK
jgi:hypothetical protein